MVTKVTQTQPNNVGRGFRMPTHDELVSTYKGIADRAMKDGHLKKMARAPAGWEKASAYNVAGGALGVGKQVYAIKGELYLKTQVVAPNTKPSWYKLGPMPMF